MIFAFSGSSCSGKTTFAKYLKDILGDGVVFYDEMIRDILDNEKTTITEIRKDAKKYFNIQVKVIFDKMKQEDFALENQKDKIVIFDRSIVDSFYYFTHYIDKNILTGKYLEKYNQILKKIIDRMYKMPAIYDKIFMFSPISQYDGDNNYRINHGKIGQLNEYNTLNILTKGALGNRQDLLINFNVEGDATIFNFIKSFRNNIDINNYIDYKEETYKFYDVENIISNIYNSIPATKSDDAMLLSSCLFSAAKTESDAIYKAVNDIYIDEDRMNSRCFPNGFYKKNNIMLVGEAPGSKGRGINKYYLKPTMFFERTSYFCREAIRHNLNDIPYITNFSKYARKDKSIFEKSDFDKCVSILKYEIDMMKPRCVIALGENVWNNLKNSNIVNRNILYKMMHPSAPLYTGEPLDEYIKRWEVFRNV
jgi:uracil-DNA glycosylase/predicted ATPase